MALLLHTSNSNKNAFKALIAADYVGVKIECTQNFEFGVSNRTPEFLKLNPFGKVPVLETPDGPLFESNAIARYVARLVEDSPLLGSSAYESALIEQWIDVATTEVDAVFSKWLYPLLGFRPYVEQAVEAAFTEVTRSLVVLNSYFASNTYLVGHSVTLADIVMACNLLMAFRTAFTKEFLSAYPHLERYFWTMANQPNFKKHFGIVQLAEKLPSPPSTKQENPAKKGSQQQPKQTPKPQEKKPKAKETPSEPKEEQPVLDEEEEEKPKPKPKNPLDLLPPSPMILDEWKRLYSNTKAKDFRDVAIKGFWNMFDPEGYSLWFCDYKYNDENTVTFVTMNKVSGFLQRMDLARKYAFAKICILGEAAPFKIKGVWLFRGSEIPKMVQDECYDAELYEWTKVDLADEGQKERVNAYFEEPDEIDGEKLLEAKCFK